MGAEGNSPEELRRRLTVDFSAWLDQKPVTRERFYRDGIIVLDANVLLDLYRLTPDSRDQILNAFRYVGDRLWVPHQAAVEFSRNRKGVVEDRMSAFKRTGQLLRTVTTDAVGVIESALQKLQSLREDTGTIRGWNPDDFGLGRDDLLALLEGVMDSALNEFDSLEAEHDLHPKDMQSIDPLLSEIDDLLAGKIGGAYSSAELRMLVDEAHSFRFPNEIPPGYLDVRTKENKLRASGDFILWRQTIDMASRIANRNRLILLITRDLKADWWELSGKGRPKGPRPELVQEMRDTAGADLLLVTLKEFIGGTKEYLSSEVSEKAIDELREVSDDADAILPEIFRDSESTLNLLELHPAVFERLVHYLLIQMGYEVDFEAPRFGDAGFDFIVTHPEAPNRKVIVQSKRYHRAISISTIHELIGAMRSSNQSAAMLFATSELTKSARAAAQSQDIEVIAGLDLIDLLATHGIRAKIIDPRYVNRDNDPRGPWLAMDITTPIVNDANTYTVIRPDGGEVHPPTGRGWRFSKERFEEFEADGRIYWTSKENSLPRLKRFAPDRSNEAK